MVRDRLSVLETKVEGHSQELVSLRQFKHKLPSIELVQNLISQTLEDQEKQIRVLEQFHNRIYGAAIGLGAVSGLIAALIIKVIE